MDHSVVILIQQYITEQRIYLKVVYNGKFLVKMSVCRVYSILICQITDIIYICNLTFKEYTLVVSTLLRLIYDLMVQVKLGSLEG